MNIYFIAFIIGLPLLMLIAWITAWRSAKKKLNSPEIAHLYSTYGKNSDIEIREASEKFELVICFKEEELKNYAYRQTKL